MALFADITISRLSYSLSDMISTNCSAAKQLPQFSNIRNPLIYYVNRYFLMFGGATLISSYTKSVNHSIFTPKFNISD